MLELGEAEENRRVAGGTGQEEGRPEVHKVKGPSRRPPRPQGVMQGPAAGHQEQRPTLYPQPQTSLTSKWMSLVFI